MNRPYAVPLMLPRGPEYYWRVACYFEAGFTIGDLAGCTSGVAYSTVKDWVWRLEAQGDLKRIGRRATIAGQYAHIYGVVKKRAKAPVVRRPDYQDKRGKIQQALWTAMRTLPQFGAAELSAAASTDTQPVSSSSAKEYIRKLANAGVLTVIQPYAKGRKGACGARGGLWRLAPRMNTGPQAPRIFQTTIVFDANRRIILGESEVRA